MRCLLLFLAVMATVFPAWADEAPPVLANFGSLGSAYLVCDATSSTGICTGPGGDQAVLDTGGFTSIIVDISQSSASSIDCDVVGNNVGYDAENDGTVLNSTPLSTTQFAISFTDTPRFVWITCGTVSGGNVTATIFGRGNR